MPCNIMIFFLMCMHQCTKTTSPSTGRNWKCSSYTEQKEAYEKRWQYKILVNSGNWTRWMKSYTCTPAEEHRTSTPTCITLAQLHFNETKSLAEFDFVASIVFQCVDQLWKCRYTHWTEHHTRTNQMIPLLLLFAVNQTNVFLFYPFRCLLPLSTDACAEKCSWHCITSSVLWKFNQKYMYALWLLRIDSLTAIGKNF